MTHAVSMIRIPLTPNERTRASTLRSAVEYIAVLVLRWRVPRLASASSDFLDRTSDIRIAESKTRPRRLRRYRYIPTYILRGLTQLHLEFDVR